MSVSEAAHGQAVMRQPDDGLTIRQPIPANGHADPKLFSGNTNFETLSTRYQTVAAEPFARQTDIVALERSFGTNDTANVAK